ncbi:FadR/GntR family transcriptional regulator [Alkalibacter saccharofermentans]|uniref:DNA-binding transcriptional regulator, FadR family n=1 Tax=Alkalibacter saccharofermentans DSM 14828 TaxID=1120975 RepID=A0A1M4U1L3_9FIRM|nr:FadR/GntR family transcriptional regulator [Alkalibacter saccharofermentans]SHE50553.1 DNA-binding transcriptional regulator, FadR family [Alkalibacter saccharofermentans DSM 14828]
MEQLTTNQDKPLVVRVADNIIEYIVDNKVAVGSKIPNEFELAQRLGVGRSTIREAIKLLVSRNILEIRRGAGTFVSDKHGIADDPLGLTFVKDSKQLAIDLVDVRLMLEPEIAALAAKNATPEDLEELMVQCKKVEELIRRGEDHTEEDIKFHGCIAKCSKNQVVQNLVPIINSSVAVFVNITHRRLLEETIETHREVAEAICSGDAETARHAMAMHLIYNRRLIKKMIENEMAGSESENNIM